MEDKFKNIYESLIKDNQILKWLTAIFANSISDELRYGKFYSIYSDRILNPFNEQEYLLDYLTVISKKIPFYSNMSNNLSNYQVINKRTIKNHFNDFINPELKNKLLLTNTGGSSGTPFEFYIQKNVSRPKEKAHFDWFWGQFGYTGNEKILRLRGKPLYKNKLFENQFIDHTASLSCYSLNEKNIKHALFLINRFNPQYFHAYPSSLKIFTSYIKEAGLKFDLQLKAIFLSSEGLLTRDRIELEEYYKCKIVHWYGHSERLIHGGNCPYSNEYHFYNQYGLLELIDQSNNIIDKPGESGRIIATGFDNYVMPFIRYDTDDLGVLSEQVACKCGFKGITLKEIIGRTQDFIVLNDNTKVSLTAFIYGQHLVSFSKIHEMQILQNKIGEIIISIIKTKNYSSEDEILLKRQLLSSVNNKLSITFNYPEFIQKTSSGKHKFLISNVQNGL